MADIDLFVSSPSCKSLNKCTKEQLLKVADYYQVVISDKRLKENIKVILKARLIEKGILKAKMDKSVPVDSQLQSNLSFEQQKELLLLQMEHEKLKQRFYLPRTYQAW